MKRYARLSIRQFRVSRAVLLAIACISMVIICIFQIIMLNRVSAVPGSIVIDGAAVSPPEVCSGGTYTISPNTPIAAGNDRATVTSKKPTECRYRALPRLLPSI